MDEAAGQSLEFTSEFKGYAVLEATKDDSSRSTGNNVASMVSNTTPT